MGKRRARGEKRRHPAVEPATGAAWKPQRRLVWTALGLFAASLALRVLFVLATPDATWAYGAALKGDAPLWLDYAQALRTGQTFELGLPIHPPGTAYLLSWLWQGDAAGVPGLRILWSVLGALTVAATWVAAVRSFGSTVGLLSGVLACASTGLIVLSSSIDAETPYLLLVAASFVLVEDLRVRPRTWSLGLWAALNAAACLFRVEHVLAFLLIAVWLASRWRRQAPPATGTMLRRTAVLAAFFFLPLVPWHVHAWRAIARFNTEPPVAGPVEAAALAQVEARLAGMVWEDDAHRSRDALPAFLRRTAADFVAATVAHRGGARVSGEDVRILEEAFGSAPRPLARFPFVSAYGPLNFALAHHPAAGAGFSRAALEEAPLLAGGAERYPPYLVRGLPPAELTLVYPPHLRLFNDGYDVGARWIVANPGRALRLAWQKLRIFWSGAALGITGHGVPTGLSGTRRAVDMVTPDDGLGTRLWQLAVLAACGLGLVAGARHAALAAWLLYSLSKVVATILFFGYARQGALVIPVVAVLVALAAEHRLGSGRDRRSAGVAMALLLAAVTIEAARFARRPQVWIDGRPAMHADPFPSDLHRDQKVEIR